MRTVKQALSTVIVLVCGSAVATPQSGSGISSSEDIVSQSPQEAFRNLFGGVPVGTSSDDLQTSGSYVIGPEDELTVHVWEEPDLTTQVFVRFDGKISVPLLNDVQASGLTPRQLQERVTEGLKEFIASPQVSVLVSSINSRVVYVYGRGASSPGSYPLTRPIRVFELLIQAGGFAEFSDEDRIQILRMKNGEAQWYSFDAGEYVDGENYEQNIELQNGDLIIVP